MFTLLESVRNMLQNHTTLPTLDVLLHYLGNYKFKFFCRYSANVEENANNLHFGCMDINLSTRVTVYAECIYALTEYLKYLNIQMHSYCVR